MERKKQTGPSSSSSSSSFTSDLFGSKEYPPSSMGIFGSIFAPTSPKVLGRESLRSEVADKKQDSANDAWNTNSGTPASDLTSKRNEGESQSTPNKDMSSIYQEQRVQPCHLSSSIYYGGQDIYHHPSVFPYLKHEPSVQKGWP
ncbi:PLANT/T7H20-70 PROTEIN [Salix purpurea]|uniref:PLANT/T7H20-70 PROTEIN n=1 Tax=Salix purpurea TaxID=77065 RepID=A0A9Q0Q4B7_SALPP|nr:PLANT/T7H20-70 PROTEIN [Salix purpurea]